MMGSWQCHTEDKNQEKSQKRIIKIIMIELIKRSKFSKIYLELRRVQKGLTLSLHWFFSTNLQNQTNSAMPIWNYSIFWLCSVPQIYLWCLPESIIQTRDKIIAFKLNLDQFWYLKKLILKVLDRPKPARCFVYWKHFLI